MVKDKSSGELKTLTVDGVFVETGYVTRTEFLKGFIALNENGEIIVDNECRTNKPGIFAAGDVTGMPYKQAVIAAGMGATAALSAYNYLARLKGRRTVKADWKHVKLKSEEKRGGLFLKV